MSAVSERVRLTVDIENIPFSQGVASPVKGTRMSGVQRQMWIPEYAFLSRKSAWSLSPGKLAHGSTSTRL